MVQSAYNVQMKVLSLAIVFTLIFSFPVEAKSDKSHDKSNGKSSAVMPSTGSPYTSGYEAAKKAIEDSLKEDTGEEYISLKEWVEEAFHKVSVKLDAMHKKDSEEKSKKDKHQEKENVEPQKGDPKTPYSKRENRRHSKKHNTTPGVPAVEGWDVTSESVDPVTGERVVTYTDPSGNLNYDYAIVTYDKSGKPVSALGYKTVDTNVMPDVSGLSLIYSSETPEENVYVYSDNPDSALATLYTVVYYNPPTVFSKATIRTITDLPIV